jgi:hypothetical protein
LAKVFRNSDGGYLGGFACEYAGNGSAEEAEANLQQAMQQLFARRYKTKSYKRRSGSNPVPQRQVPREVFNQISQSGIAIPTARIK